MNIDRTSTRILIVDDQEEMRHLEARLLEAKGYRCTLAADAAAARQRMKDGGFALALTDVNMPGESGIELIGYVRREYPDTAVVMVTVADDPQVADLALRMGAYGYVIKPFKPGEFLINVAAALRRRELEIENRAHRVRLEQLVTERTAALDQAIDELKRAQMDLRVSHEEAILRLARAAEFRHAETGQHVERMSRYCALLVQRLGYGADRSETIRLASILHDVGKIGIPDRILLNPGPLGRTEFELMKQHTEIGHRILSGSKSELLQLAATIALTHHEKYDGTGYPRGLTGDAIPLEGRIAAIADVFDALTTSRVYKPAFPIVRSLERMRQERGKHFDPSLLDLFLACAGEVEAIRKRFADNSRATFLPVLKSMTRQRRHVEPVAWS